MRNRSKQGYAATDVIAFTDLTKLDLESNFVRLFFLQSNVNQGCYKINRGVIVYIVADIYCG